MNRLWIAVGLIAFVPVSFRSCLAQTNMTSVCLLGWSAASGSGVQPVALSWTYTAADADGIGIERSTSADGPWSLIGIVKPTATNYVDDTVSCATSYWYRVYAFNAAGDSGFSNTAGPSLQRPCPYTTSSPASVTGYSH